MDGRLYFRAYLVMQLVKIEQIWEGTWSIGKEVALKITATNFSISI